MDASPRAQRNSNSGDTRLITIVVVDDHLLFRQGVRALFADTQDLYIVGEASTGEDAVEMCRALQPMVVLMDLNLGRGMDGIQATREIIQDCPGTNVVIISTFYSEDYVLPAMKAGAKGYLVKSTGIDNVKRAIRLAASGGSMIDPLLTPVIMSEYRRMVSAPGGDRGPSDGLTDRESTLLKLLAAGYSNRQIAGELSLAESTIKNNLSALFHKIGVRDRTQAVLYAIDAGVVSRSTRSS